MKNFKFIALVLSLGLSMVACQKDSCNDDEQQPNPTQKMMVSFSIPDEGSEFNYIYDGYTVIAEGAQSQDTLTNVDLTKGPFEVDVVGDVELTVFHPDFDADKVDTKAFFGTSNQILPAAENEEVNIVLDLVQGYVLVNSEDGSENLVKEVEINGTPSELNTIYYTATPRVEVEVNTTRGLIEGENELVIGQGLVYTVHPMSTSFSIVFQSFGDPIEGELN